MFYVYNLYRYRLHVILIDMNPIDLWFAVKHIDATGFKKNGDLDLCFTLPHSIYTEYYAEEC